MSLSKRYLPHWVIAFSKGKISPTNPSRNCPLLRLSVLFLVLASSVFMWVGCSHENVLGPREGSEFPDASSYTTEPIDGLSIGPIEGFTTAWHRVPDRALSVPFVESITLRYDHAAGMQISWEGAEELSKGDGYSVAICRIERVRNMKITATARPVGGAASILKPVSCELIIIDRKSVV